MKTKHYLLQLLISLATLEGIQAQNTNLGSNAGNAGSANTSIGYFAGDVVTGNLGTFVGHQAGKGVTTGNYNSFVGAFSGLNTTTAAENSFFGYASGISNSTGARNTFVGALSGLFNTTGAKNSFVGAYAGHNNTLGSHNSFFGNDSGNKNSIGGFNSFFGSGTGFSNTTGSSNTLAGYNAGYTNTSGSENTFVGIESGYSNSTGSVNTFIGNKAGRSNTVGLNNTFIGNLAGWANDKESANTFVGATSGVNAVGGHNTFLGYGSGQSAAGNYNVFAGANAGIGNSAGNSNVFIGRSAGSSNNGSDNVFIGNEAGAFTVGSGLFVVSNAGTTTPLLYGNFSTQQLGIGTTSLGTYALSVNGDAFATGLWLSSDKRFKQSEKTITGALEKLDKIKGVSYQFKKGEAVKGRIFSEGDQLGFIAQDLQKIFPELVKENSDGYLAVNYSGMVPVLVEAIKELKLEISNLKKQLEVSSSGKNESTVNTKLPVASLQQNYPNPFNQETLIGYSLPDGASSSALYIFDLTGKQVSAFENLKPGKNELSITAAKLSPGLYHYSLVVNGQIIDTKKMLLTN